jgi:hypothetical protein
VKRVVCLKSHKQPGPGPGKWTSYEVGREYDVENPDPALFRSVPVPEKKRKKYARRVDP